jgi:prepilin-type N-terminal cleavage/methylation domain-containing protein
MRLQRSARRRRGFSLTEVLIAIFVLALGLMGVMSLFVLGTVRMAQAVKDDRCALANHNGTTLFRLYWKDQLALVPPLQQKPDMPPYQIRDYFFDAMLNPNAAYLPPAGVIPPAYQSNLTPAIPFYANLPGYPVFVDAIGFNNPYNSGQMQQFWVGGAAGSIPRRSLRDLDFSWNGTAYAPRPSDERQRLTDHNFILMDDIGFANDGTPTNSTGQSMSNLPANQRQFQVQVDGRYSWAYLLRRPKAIFWDIADLSVVVYSGRAVDGPINETLCFANFVPGRTDLTLIYSGTRPNVRKGTWLLDATMYQPVASQFGATTPEPHGFFYRVISVTDEQAPSGGNPGTITVELQQQIQSVSDMNGTPIPDSLNPHGNGNPFTPYGVVAVLDNVVEVFDRKTLTSVITPVP